MGKQRLSDASQRKGFSKTARTANIAPIIFLALLSVILAIAAALVLREYFEARELAAATAIEKAECEQRANELLDKLNALDAAYQGLIRQNADLEQLAARQRNEINRLRAQIQSVAGSQQLDDVKARIEQLEQELASYQTQVNSLSENNANLLSENSQVKVSLTEAQDKIGTLEVNNQNLSQQINKASALKIMNVEVITTQQARSGERLTTRAGRVDRIQVCFTILENILTTPGNKTFFVRVTGPNGRLITNGQSNTFELNGNQVTFTISRAFEYKNEQQIACMVFTPSQKLEKGIYGVAVYAEGRELGTRLFELK